jgi:hypothetical protein
MRPAPFRRLGQPPGDRPVQVLPETPALSMLGIEPSRVILRNQEMPSCAHVMSPYWGSA